MSDVATPLTNLVKKYTGFENFETLLNQPLSLNVSGGGAWVNFTKALLCDIYDNVQVCRGKRNADDTFVRANRSGHKPGSEGRALDRVLAANFEARQSSWTLRAMRFRAAFMYYANRPVVKLEELKPVAHHQV